ncbi:MAG: hypothetical protein ACXWCY_02480 [Burkholderiales bacterium]
MNFGQWWKAALNLPTNDIVYAAVLAACAIIGAAIALYVVIPLATERWKERHAKRLRRHARSKRYVSGTLTGHR